MIEHHKRIVAQAQHFQTGRVLKQIRVQRVQTIVAQIQRLYIIMIIALINSFYFLQRLLYLQTLQRLIVDRIVVALKYLRSQRLKRQPIGGQVQHLELCQITERVPGDCVDFVFAQIQNTNGELWKNGDVANEIVVEAAYAQ